MANTAERRDRASAIVEQLLLEYGLSYRSEPLAELLDGLFLMDEAGVGWLAGVTEFSVSFQAGHVPRVRCMAETISRRRLDARTAAVGREWGSALVRLVAGASRRARARALFEDVYRTVYEGPQVDSIPYRFGLALELGQAAPKVKAYFDLHAVPEARRGAVVDELERKLGGALGLRTWRAACPDVPVSRMRVLGLDFSADGPVRGRLYRGGNVVEWSGVERLSDEIGGAGALDRETLDCLRRDVCGLDAPLSAVLVSVASQAEQRSLKLDVSLPRIFSSDRQAVDAVARFLRARFGSSVDAETPFRIVSGQIDPARSKRILQYLGVELLRTWSPPRVSLYYRPLGFETEHMSPAIMPELREEPS